MTKLNKTELIIIVLIFIISLFLIFIFNKSNNSGIVVIDNNNIKTTYALNKSKLIKLNNGVEVKIDNNKVKVIKSPCHNQICVKHKSISKCNEQIVCLPLNVVISIENNGENKLDSISN